MRRRLYLLATFALAFALTYLALANASWWLIIPVWLIACGLLAYEMNAYCRPPLPDPPIVKEEQRLWREASEPEVYREGVPW